MIFKYFFTIDNPKPIPVFLVVIYGSVILSIKSVFIPPPLSSIIILIYSSFTFSIFILIVPLVLSLDIIDSAEFLTMFVRTCVI